MTTRTWIRRLLALTSRTARKDQTARPRSRTRLRVEELEPRLAPATYTVLTTGDPTGLVTPVGPGAFTASPRSAFLPVTPSLAVGCAGCPCLARPVPWPGPPWLSLAGEGRASFSSPLLAKKVSALSWRSLRAVFAL
jgi:hypothetical protein